MRYTITFLSLAAFLFATHFANAQNAKPVITNVIAVADTTNHRVDVSFDLADAENDSLEVWIQVSPDSGRTWRVVVDSSTGDQGFPILAGSGKSISWHYQTSALTAYANGLTGFRVRVIADDRIQIDLNDVLALIDSSRVHSDLLMIEGVKHRTTGLAKLVECGDSIEARMNAFQLHPYRQGKPYGGYVCQNITGRSSGTRSDSLTWAVSGHYDTVDNAPGGDDNASAMVVVLEAMRVLSSFQTKNSLRYYGFDLEEPGLVGSTQYVVDAMPAWENLRGLVNMDAIGYYSNEVNSQQVPFGFSTVFPAAYAQVQADSFRGNFITSIVNTASSYLDTVFNQIAMQYVPALKIISVQTQGTGLLTPDLRRSDHAPFWDAGKRGLFLSHGANFRNPNYHTPTDVVDSLNMPFLMNNVKAVILTLAHLAQPEHSATGESNTIQINLPAAIAAGTKEISPEIIFAPNPNNGKFKTRLTLPEQGNIRLEILDHHGRQVALLKEGFMKKGTHEIEVELNLAADQYLCKLITEKGLYMQPLVIVH